MTALRQKRPRRRLRVGFRLPPERRFNSDMGMLEKCPNAEMLRGELGLAIVTAPQPNDHLEVLVVEHVFLIGPRLYRLLKRSK
jgi:LysR family nitrogen assimilation transcriptional regulator